MAINGNFTHFGTSGGGSGSQNDFIQDAFADGSLPANSNSGLTSNANTNPLNESFLNDDAVVFGTKTLYIKELTLVENRSLWINQQPTYRITWNEPFFAVKGYVFGDFVKNSAYDQTEIHFKSGGIGVGGIIRRVAWLVRPSTSASATGQLALDNVNTSTIDFSNLNSNSDTYDKQQTYRIPIQAQAANETKDLHDFRLSAIQELTLRIIGVTVYFEDSGSDIEIHPGNTYVNKTKAISTDGATFPLAVYGSSLGGSALYYKLAGGNYATLPISASTFASQAMGSSGTNLVTVTTGDGANFPNGTGIVIAQGTSMYVGSVLSLSTDTLTVSPTLPFGISNAVYSSWSSAPTLSIASTLFQLGATISFADKNFFSNMISGCYDSKNQWSVAALNVATPCGPQLNGNASLPPFTYLNNPVYFRGASGYLQIDGYFAAAEILTIGSGIADFVVSVNGTPGHSISAGQTGIVRRTLVTRAASGWNSIVLQPGASYTANTGFSLQVGIGILGVNLYDRTAALGITFGGLAVLNTQEAYTERFAINASLMALGTYRRLYSDQLYLKGGWVRNIVDGAAANVRYDGASTNSVLNVQYYGKNFSVIGTAGASAILQLDGTSIAVNFNQVIGVTTEGWHSVSYQHQGGTSSIEAFDYGRTHAEIQSLQRLISKNKTIRIPKSVPPTSYTPQVSGTGPGTESFMTYWQLGPVLYIAGTIDLEDTPAGGIFIGLPAGYIGIRYPVNRHSFPVGSVISSEDNTRSLVMMLAPGGTYIYPARQDGGGFDTARSAGSLLGGNGLLAFNAMIPLMPEANGSFYDEVTINGVIDV